MSESKSKQPDSQQFHTFPQHHDDTTDYIFDTLKRGIDEVLEHNKLQGMTFETFYHGTYLMVLHKADKMLYNSLIETIKHYLTNNVRPTIENAINDNFISVLIKFYGDYTDSMEKFCDLMSYMERTYIANNKLEPIMELGLRLFREEIVNHAAIKEKLKATMMDMRQTEPEGTSFKQVYKMLTALGIEKEFDAAMIVYAE